MFTAAPRWRPLLKYKEEALSVDGVFPAQEENMPHMRFVGLDVHKKKIAVAIAEDGRNGEVLSYGSVDNTPTALAKLLQKLGKDGAMLHLCYEAGGCGYSVYRQIVNAGQLCDVIAPSLIPRATGDRVKTDRR